MDYYSTQVRREEASALRARLASVVEQHEQELFETQQHFRQPTDATYWSPPHDAITLQLGDSAVHSSASGAHRHHHHAQQRRQLQLTSVADVLGTTAMAADPVLLRVCVMLAALTAETRALAEEGRRCYAAPLSLVGDESENCYRSSSSSIPTTLAGGESGAASTNGGGGAAASEEEAEALREEQLLHQTGHLLSALQDLWLWRQRVQEVCGRLLCQLACIYQEHGGSRNACASLAAVRLTSCWDGLADLLGVVVVVDELLQQNRSLHDGLEVMQRVLAQQTMEAEEEAGGGAGVDDGEGEVLRLLLHRLEGDLLRRRLLLAVVGQNFDRLLRLAASESSTAKQGSGGAARPPAPALPPPFRENKALCAECAAVLSARCNSFDAALHSAKGATDKSAFAAICGLSALFHAVFTAAPPPTRAATAAAAPPPVPVTATAVAKAVSARLQHISKQVVAWQALMPLVPLHGLYALCPLLWWQRCFPAEVAAGLGKAAVGQRIQESVVAACQTAGSSFLTRVAQWSAQVERWAGVEMHGAMPLDPPLCRHFVQRLVLLIQQGLQLARAVQAGLVELLFYHHHAERALSTSLVGGVLRGVLLLQRVAAAYHSKTGILASSQEALVQSIAYVLERHLYSLFTRLCAEAGRGSDRAAPQDQLAALQGALHLLRRPITTDGLRCLALLLDIALNREQLHANAPPSTATEAERDEAFIALAQLQSIATYQEAVPAATGTAFLYAFRESLYPLFFRQCYESTLLASSLPGLVAALTGSRGLVMSARHVEGPAETLLADYAAFLGDCLHHEVVQPLCAEVENQLRLRTHDVVLGQPYRELRPSAEAAGRDLTRFTLLPPFRLFHSWVRLAAHVEHYLSTQFYNLNALTPNDWRTYEEMRNLAHRIFRLSIANSHLPGCILDQGLDVLVITENIHQFIAYYTYNLNEQVFIQRPSLTASRHLHTLSTRHIANSIRTHGTGVMNTAVNYVYKCLLKKMAVLSRFLQDDYVRSRLLRDARLVRQRKKEHQPTKYPTEQAEQLTREMDRLGVAEDGFTFLEKARQLVGEMGNALGFMRMMRSGGLRAVAEGARFVPLPASAQAAGGGVRLSSYVSTPPPPRRTDDSEGESDDDGDDDAAGAAGGRQSLRQSTAAAVVNLDHITHSMLQQLSEGSEYFPLLLDAIGRRLRRSSPERYAHLHLLYLLVPALANLHVAYAVQEKEKLLKKHKDEGVFSDDGFAVGTTFLLVLFGIYDDFEALHWFDSKKKQYRQSLESVHAALSAAEASGSRDFDNVHLTASTLHTNLKEYTGLENAFTSSRLFFRSAASGGHAGGGEGDEAARRGRHASSRRARGEGAAGEEDDDEDDERGDDEEGEE